jgi:hypothetical protein
VRRLLTVLALAGACLALVTPVAGARSVPPGFFGAMANGPLDLASTDLGAEFGVMRSAGVESIRLPMEWAAVQPYASFADVPAQERERFVDAGDGRPSDFTALDARVLAAAGQGISVLGLVLRCPVWAAKDPGRAFSPPRDDAQYARFLRTLIGRYGPNGFLWQAHPDVRRVAVRDWQIWNEPNLSNYFSQQPYARPYARLLAASYRAVHAADAGARVVMAGLANYSWRELEKLYGAGVKGDFDVAAVHPFSGRPSNSVKITRLNREVMDRHGDRTRPIWLTELTWSSAKGKKTNVQHNWEVTEAQQGTRLRQAYELFARSRRALRLGRIYWYTWASTDRDSPNSFDYSGLRTLLPDGTLADKPALGAFRAVVRRLTT